MARIFILCFFLAITMFWVSVFTGKRYCSWVSYDQECERRAREQAGLDAVDRAVMDGLMDARR